MKPKYNSSRLLNTRFGASLSTIITVCFGSAGIALATDWVGDVSTDWNNNLNWAGDAGTAGSNAVINTTGPNTATISANIVATPVDIFVGNESPNVGRLDHTAGTAQTGGGNWMFVGRRGGTGTYNLANPAGTGGALTGMGQGSGSLNVGGRLYVGGWELTGSNGKANIHTTGTVNITRMLQIGVAESTGEFNLDSGTVNIGEAGQSSWFEVGNGVNCTGLFRMGGGTVTKIGNDHFSIGTNQGNGTAKITGGTMTINNEIWVGQRPNSVGLLEISPGVTITNNSWVAVGREGGKGTVNMTGGTWNKNGTSNFIIGASGANGTAGEGTMNLSGGTVTVAPNGEANRGITWIGEQDLSSGTLTMSGAANATTFSTARMTLGESTGATGTLNLNGGTLRVGQLTGGAGTANVSFNGGTIVATAANQANFITGLDAANVDANGLTIDTNGNNVIVPQVLGGGGTITKTGSGKLTLSGANTANGNIVVSAGSVVATTAASAGGTITVANGSSLGVIQTAPAATYTRTSVAMGTSAATSIDIDLGSAAGNPTVAALTVGTINLAGTVTVNIADALPAVGTPVPIIAYTSKTGAGNFTLGTLPLGVVATLTDNNAGSVFLNITSVKLPRWTGAINGNWDVDTENWFDLVTNGPTKYADPAPALFDDNATGTTDVVLGGTVAPGKVTFANTANATGPAPLGKNYTLTGGGKITGTASLVKQGGGNLTIGTANDYTGSTTFEGGVTSINSIANAGTASAIGAASVDPANLVLNATTLTYTGAAAGTTNRGFTIAGTNTILSSANDLTFSGAVASTGGNLTKTGAGNLTLSGTGANVIGTVNQGLKVTGGTMTFQGGGTQTNAVAGEMWVSDTPAAAANLVVNGAALNVQSWIAIGRGNGTTGNVCNMTVTNSTISCNNFSTGFDNGVTGNNATQNVTVTNSTWNNPGFTFVAESGGSTATLTLAGATTYTCGNDFLLARNAGATATMDINGTSSVVKTGGYSSIAQGGTATLNINNSGSFNANGDVNVSDVGTSNGTINMNSTGTFSAGNILFVGKGATTTGAFNQSAGTVNVGSWVSIARYVAVSPATGNSVGSVSVTGGTFNQTGTGQGLIVGEEGAGTLTIATTGTVNVAGNAGVLVSNNAAGDGTVNLNAGGTLITKRVSPGAGGAGSAKFYFNGGTLVAAAGANADFLTGMDIAEISAQGAKIDTGANNIAFNQGLAGVGGITKTGSGTLLINGSADNEGATVVSAGTLGGIGTIIGDLTVASGASVSPGAPLGMLTALGNTTFSAGSSLAIDLDASPDMLAAVNLTLNNTALVLNGTPTQAVYLLARYGSLSGTFSTPAPAGYAYDYNYVADGFSHVALVQTGGGSPYATWINTFFPGETNQAIIGASADPDKDGSSNILEFALGGAPNSGSNNAKVFSLQDDSSADGDTNKELLLTIAVRTGTPAFEPPTGGSPTATHDGVVYTIQGSVNLSGFATGVSRVTTVPPVGVTLPSGYEFRTFSLEGSNNLTGKGFLRATVRPTP